MEFTVLEDLGFVRVESDVPQLAGFLSRAGFLPRECCVAARRVPRRRRCGAFKFVGFLL